MEKRILFLGYGKEQTVLPKWLEQFGQVEATGDRVDSLAGYDTVVVYGYRYILKSALLSTSCRPPINLHISFLPFNRGAHPNFWSWVERTPAGVTIHEIDKGIDTGPIIQQKKYHLEDPEATFEQTYYELRKLAEQMFIETFPSILEGDYLPFQQQGQGSFHKASDLPTWVSWKMKIREAQERFERK